VTPPRVNAPVRVLIVAPGECVGGHAHAARDIVEGFAKNPSVSIEFQAISPRLRGPLRFLTEWKFVRSIVRPLLYIRSLIPACRRAQVLHVFAAAHTAFLFGALPALIVAKWKGKPVILNYHDGRAEAHFRWWGPVLRWAIRQAAVLVFPSVYLQDVFARRGFQGVVVPNVVDTDTFTYRSPDPVQPRLISARLLERLYAVDNTLQAFALIKREVPGAVLDIYGTGTAARSLQRSAERLGVEGIRFHGEVPRSHIAAALAEGGILVNSSRVDNMPHIIIEAFAAGVPVVTTAAGGIPRIVTHEQTGLLVPIDQPEGLAAAVLRVLREPGLAVRLAQAAGQESKRYSWPAAERGWLEVYTQCRASPARAWRSSWDATPRAASSEARGSKAARAARAAAPSPAPPK
jgi:glycosyltransferase involved in cell wall biosynthesis